MTEVAREEDRSVTFQAVAGTTYQIVVDSIDSRSGYGVAEIMIQASP